MLGKSKTKNNFGIISTLKDKKFQYISRSTNKKISKNDNINVNNKQNNKDKYKMSSNLIDVNKNKNSNDKYKKYIPEFSQNNCLVSLFTNNQNLIKNNNKINKNNNLSSLLNNKMYIVDNNQKNKTPLFFNISEEMKINSNNIISLNKQKNKNIYHSNVGLENINNLNIQKYNIKKNYDEYINSNNNSIEENCKKNKNNIYINKKGSLDKNLILETNNIVRNNPSHKGKNNANYNNKYIIQKILTNLFSSNKKKSNNENSVKKESNIIKKENKYFINDSFNNKITNYETKNYNNNYFNKEKKYTEKNKDTPRLKSCNKNNKKKISGLFSANPKDKTSKLITEINNSKSKKTGDNYTKRNLSINIHSYKGNDYKFKTSIDLDLNIQDNNIENKNMPKINLNQVFNLKLYDKNNSNNNKNKKSNNFVSLNNISIGDKNIENNINIVSNTKNKKLPNSNNNNNLKDNYKNKSNTFFINTRMNEQNIKDKNHKSNRENKFSPKNIYIKGIKKLNVQRFFSYTKNKTNLNNNIEFMNNIKKINFNDTKKSPSKNTTRRGIISNDNNKKHKKITEIIFFDNKRINNKKHSNISSSAKKQRQKEIIRDSNINIRKRKPKYSDINRIIEINNLKCMKYINNSEINNLKKIYIDFSTNEANENKSNNKFNNYHKRNNSASHQSMNNHNGIFMISKIGSIFKPRIDNNIRKSFNEQNNKNKNKINYNLISILDNKSKEKKIKTKNAKHKSKYLGIYESNKKVNEYNNKVNLDLEKINVELEENKTKENILQNTLTMYSIYILSKYYNTCEKIGIAGISLYDREKNFIPIEYSITNERINVNYLFNNNSEFSPQNDIFNNSTNFPFISNFEPNFCINFYIKNIYISNLEYIDISNYSDINNGISPIKEIKIFKTDILLYKGIIELKNQNLIKINKNHNNENNVINIDNLEKKKKTEMLNENKKSLTYTIFKSLINENSDFTENILKLNRYNSARNNFKENYINSSENINTNFNNNYDYNDDINNKINIKSKSFIQNSDFGNNKENENTENIMFFKTSQENSNMNHNISLFSNKNKDLSNTNISNINLYTSEILDNEKEIILSKTLKNPNNSSKLFLNSYNSASDDYNNLFRTSVGYGGLPDFTNLSMVNTQSLKPFLELNKISIYLKSNYGHKKFIGLTGIIFLDENNEQIDIEKAKAIGALPKDLRTIYNDDSDNRIFENLFNGINNTNDSDNMWVTRIKKNEIPYFELFFEEKIKLAKIIIYNYNQKDSLEIGTKEIDVYIDNYFFQKFKLIQGTGEVAYIYQEKKNISKYDFGQELIFNNDYINKNNIDTNEDNISKEINIEDLGEIKYASLLCDQCYETPYLPCGNIIKIQLMSFYYDDDRMIKNNRLNEFFIGLELIQIYNKEGKNILDTESNENDNKSKILSNREIITEKNDGHKNQLLLRGIYKEDENGNILYDNENYLFYIFENNIQVGYIKIFPLDSSISNDKEEKIIYFKAKEIKIFCDDKIIYEGFIYKDKPTIILFSSDENIAKNINQDYLTNNFNERKIEEIQTNNYNSLILN